MPIDHGALVISLDFELHWGMRDLVSTSDAYVRNLLGARAAVPELLATFEEYGVSATWATVGFLFARNRSELEHFSPGLRPRYANPFLDPYRERIGRDEADDPLHFAASLIDSIRNTPGQEIATQTFSHYYCLEPAQDVAAFRADLQSAVRIARARGIAVRSIVYPRNQRVPAYDDVLREAGIIAYRGNPLSWMYRPVAGRRMSFRRVVRAFDNYSDMGDRSTSWDEMRGDSALANVRASFFLRPWRAHSGLLNRAQVQRIGKSIAAAAANRRVLHVWWHPHNFGVHLRENIAQLRRLLDVFALCRDAHGMKSLTMLDAALAVLPTASRSGDGRDL